VTELLNANGASAALGLLQMQGLVQNIGTSDWTLFLPSDEAAAAFTGDINVFAHIYDVTALSAEALTGMVGGDLMLNSNGGSPVVAIAGGGTEPLTVGGHTVTTADLSIDGGTAIIHIIDGVIPAAL